MLVRFSTYLFSFPHILLDGRSSFLMNLDLDLFVSTTTTREDLIWTGPRGLWQAIHFWEMRLFIYFCLFLVLQQGYFVLKLTALISFGFSFDRDVMTVM
jgi:hypothetical protein